MYVANPPFAPKFAGIKLDKMRDGGEGGLELTTAYLKKTIPVVQKGDWIIGVAYSRIKKDGETELEPIIKEKLGDKGQYDLKIIEGRTLWREYDGIKRMANPMDLDNMYRKANPHKPEEIEKYREATKANKHDGWEKMGYFEYKIHIT